MPFLKTPFPEAISLARFISSSGFCSYKTAVALIQSGKVVVNNNISTEFWTPIHPENDSVEIENIRIIRSEEKKYYAFNKPTGLITSHSGSEGIPTVYDFVKQKGLNHWVTSAGRLDVDTSGLMVLTNDTAFIRFLSHPETKVEKKYIVNIEGKANEGKLLPLKEGIRLKNDEVCAPVDFRINRSDESFSEIELTLTEGKKRQIRRMMKILKLNLISLKRIQIGNCKLGNLPEGEFLEIKKEEITTEN